MPSDSLRILSCLTAATTSTGPVESFFIALGELW
jgi:hypothetical protein